MTEEQGPQEEPKAKEKFVLTDELREKALQKPTFNILYIGDGDSRLYPFRGEPMIRTFASFYDKHANIRYFTADPGKLATITLDELKDVNVLWIDNISDHGAARNLSTIQGELRESVEKGWSEKLSKLSEENKDGAMKFAVELNKRCSDKLRIIYSLDDFIWEGPVGRSNSIQTVQLMEAFLNMADTIVVPNPELRDAIKIYKLVQDPEKEIYVIPSAVNVDFFPLFKNFNRTGKAQISQLSTKPKVLIKGLALPSNIEEFIIENYKKMDITICALDEINDHIRGLIQKQKVSHIYHWANPMVNRSNMIATYAIERDSGFDFVIHTKPDDIRGDLYELTTGDEDMLFSISYGAIPICGVEHLDYDENSDSLVMASGIVFGKDTSARKIAKKIELNQTSPLIFNETYNKCRQKAESRLATSPFIISRYFAVMLGKEISMARAELAREKQAEMEQPEEISKKESTEPKPENVIEAKFGKGE